MAVGVTWRYCESMTSGEYAAEVAQIVGRLEDRIMGPGMLQYDDGSGKQRFEGRELDAIVQDALEEVEDLIAYACQLHIRFRQIRDSVPF
jgi:hypothetical protein